jgi:signal transduction histidine kinase
LVDRNQLQQVFFNLLSNAVKYSGPEADSFRVEVSASRSEDGYRILFRDWGLGVEDGFEEAIFREGFRTPSGVSRYVTGQGLGLWVVRQIVGAHGGMVYLSHPRAPTEFTVFLPRSLECSEAETANGGDDQ